MAAPVQLSNRPTARDSEVEPTGVRPTRQPTLDRPLPAPPAPVVPHAPLVREQVAPPAPERLQSPTVDGPEVARTRAPRPNKVVRLVIAAAVTLAVVGGLEWIRQTPGPTVPAQTVLVRVGAGETVWDVAQRVAPKSDQAAVVERIRQLNGMTASAVQPGQLLQVPDGRQ